MATEIDTYTITDLLVPADGKVAVQVDTFADKNNANDVTIVNTSTAPITLLTIEKFGDNDNQQDIIRVDLSEFSDNFTLELKNTGSNIQDQLYLEGLQSFTDNGDGTFTATYYGSDSQLYTLQILPEDAAVTPYYAPDGIITGAEGAEIMDPGYTDLQGDEIDGADGDDDVIVGGGGRDTINAGAGNDTVYGDYATIEGWRTTGLPANTYTGTPPGPDAGAEVFAFSITDANLDANGHIVLKVDAITPNKELAQDFSITDDALTEAFKSIKIEKGGGNDGSADIYRFNLATFDDDFFVEITEEDAVDRLVFEHVHSVSVNPDGTYLLTYEGSDNTFHEVTVSNDLAQVDFYLSPDSPYFYDDIIDAGTGDDFVDGGFGDDTILGGDGADTLHGGDGSDTIDGGTGDDYIQGDRTAPSQGIAETLTYSYAQDSTGNQAAHFGEQGLGTANDPLLFIDGDVNTEVRYHDGDIIEYAFGQQVPAGTRLTLIEGENGVDDGIVDVYVSFGSTDPNGDTLSSSGGGVGYENAVTNGQSVLIYSGPSDSTIDIEIPINATHIQFVGVVSHGGWAEIEFTALTSPLDPGDDEIIGGDGNDTIDAGAGNDTVDGGADDDTIYASAGTDKIDGGTGTDVYAVDGGMSLVDEEIAVSVTQVGSGSVAKTGDATTDTVTGVERFIAGEATGNVDTITITDAVDLAARQTLLQGFDDTAVGTFTPDLGGGPIAFGGAGEPTLSELLSNTYDPGTGKIRAVGTFQITSGDESAQVGNVSFENFETINFQIVCFARGTRIKTIRGEVPIEGLRAGDRVLTYDNGYQPIRWIGSTEVAAIGKLAPIHVQAGALDNTRDLLVSPQHRVLIRAYEAELYFGESEVLVPAKHLVNDREICVRPGGLVEYFHMLFNQHEIVYSEGALTESFHPGQQGWSALDAEARDEILDLFPDLEASEFHCYGDTARTSLKAKEAALLGSCLFQPKLQEAFCHAAVI